LIGISSYLLINFWFTRIQANKSGIKALTVNRVGDMFLSIGFFAIFWVFGNVDYATVFSVAPFMNETAITIIGLLLLVGAMAKSAQLGLHTWLPDRMEGPTPVSALIHAATLVTAGVYLMLRSSPIIEYGPTVLIIITWVGALTRFVAATTGLLQNDMKRVIAYSTMSQIGYLFMAVGLSQYNVALFHLVNHRFFKRLLFLAAGAVINASLIIIKLPKKHIIVYSQVIHFSNVNSNDHNPIKGQKCFGSYLRGLIEGDGSINIPKNSRSSRTNKLIYSYISIVFHIKDLISAEHIKNLISHGYIVKKPGNYCVLNIKNVRGLIIVINLINGHLRGGKLRSFTKLVEEINKRANLNIIVKPLDESPLKNNSWLAGFIDADGSFQVRTTLSGKYPKISCSFEIRQAINNSYGTSSFIIISIIADFLCVSLYLGKQKKGQDQYRIVTSNLISINTLRLYLDVHSLKSSKYLDYKDWCKIHDFVIQKRATSNIDKIISIKKGINSKRIYFT
jgi:hypothetical protein